MAAPAAPSEDAAEGAGLRMRRSGAGLRGGCSARAPGPLRGGRSGRLRRAENKTAWNRAGRKAGNCVRDLETGTMGQKSNEKTLKTQAMIPVHIERDGDVKALAADRVPVLFQAAGGHSLDCIGLHLKIEEMAKCLVRQDCFPYTKWLMRGITYEKYLIATTSQTLIQKSGSSTVNSAVDSQNQCLELVIEKGLDVNTLLSEHITSNTYGDRRDTALCCAVSNNEILCTKILLKAGTNPNKDPLNCVLIAVRADSHGIVKLFLSYGADVNC
ncbi:hypothetical protein DV515_00004383 [Chloebia gouldiae]|uniref:Uncharacterized protein n=1 Tax=Chloebia gouldiae TaxID=44316 RepID=A0A3L8SQK7_CHLGU|nr:hypothetical protein DV515_00004383 [Chloebia gouldiae]